MKRCLVVLFLGATGCGGIQTDPTCKLEEYGIIDVRNNTDEYKTVAAFRVIHDGERYKTVGKPFARLIEPMTSGRLRIHPGMVLIRIDTVQGMPWLKVFQVGICTVTTISLKNAVALRDIPDIQSRRALKDCPPCPPNKLP